MKSYKITDTNIPNYPKVVFATSYESPVPLIWQMGNEKSLKDYTGVVVLDLLMSNGFSDNRFFAFQFEDGKFLHETVRIMHHTETVDLFSYAFHFFRKNQRYVENSSLTSIAKKFLLGL